MIKAVIFDKDWVIMDSEKIHIQSVVQSLKELWINIDQEAKEHIVGKNPDHYIEYFLQRHDFPADIYRERQKEIYYELIESVDLFNDVINIIKEIKKTWMPMALTTSSSKKNADISIKIALLENVFDIIITKEDCIKWKPNPEPYLITAKKLWVNPDECLVFEDSDVWVLSAKNAWMKCVAIPNEYTKNHDVSKADLIIKDRSLITIDILKQFII